MSFKEYAAHGWALCPIREGEKRPRGEAWNKRENGITQPERAEHLVGAGLCHAFSGTCAIDIDNVDLARVWLREHGIDLDALFTADDAVMIVRGDATRGKLIYALPEPLPTKQIKNDDKTLMLLEFRCGATTGNTAQDVLPPTVHPSGKRYEWKYNSDLVDWRTLPPLPKPLHDLWLSMVTYKTQERVLPTEVHAPVATELEWVRTLLDSRDPDCDYDTWRDIGMRLHDGTAGDESGFALWNEWSARGAKYPGENELRAKWDTFGRGAGPQATLDGLRREITATDADFGAPLSDDILAQAEATQRAARDAEIAAVAWAKLGTHKNRPPPKWLIKGVLPLEPLNMMFGPSGAGKSLVAFDMCLAMARGVNWREYKTLHGAAGWLAAEALGSMRNRSRAYEKGHDNVNVDDLDFYVLGEGIDLTSRERVEIIARSAAKLGLKIIVVDTLAAASGDANENSGEDMNPVMDNCKLLHEITGASVLLIHHSGKDEAKGSRGWSGIKARVQAELEVRKRQNTDLRDIVSTKQRDGAEGNVGTFRVEVVAIDMDDDGEVMKSAYVQHVAEQESRRPPVNKGQGKWHKAIRNALAAAPNMELEPEELIIAAIKLVPSGEWTAEPRRQVVKTLKTMVEIGELREPGLGGEGKSTYSFVFPETVSGSPDADADLL